MESSDFIRHVTESQKPLAGYVYSLVGNWTDAEDILQDTNVRLWEQQDRYDAARPFLPWARTIAYYMVMAHRSKVRRERMRLADDVLELLAAETEEIDSELSCRRVALGHCLDKLPPENRRLLDLCYFGGLSIKDVAAKLNRSTAATYKSVSRVRKSLHQCITGTLAAGPAT